jgi:hypothetical protein
MRASVHNFTGVAANKSVLRWEIDLGTLKLRKCADGGIIRRHLDKNEKVQLVHGIPPEGGLELACLGCDAELFRIWLSEYKVLNAANGTNAASEEGQGARHPNSPGYDKWQKKPKVISFGAQGNKSSY